ncbi:hypothetical protein [Halapricum hydrolyticum]|uniref:Uncharacterized protein n=1 Tax=Halapricum hydrolyticum TaxID=2979991 RepID=A0AAE3LGD4_9EURY|nr:hypothetical protein [Halapricum hydrolyticum]MCU4719645.1 hypothetical protein [Halapricum hydrolyticum]MCU4728567.1 hypothetical protein [Halapricum hydrolyticum]
MTSPQTILGESVVAALRSSVTGGVVTSDDLEPIDENSTEVTFTMSFVPKYGPVGWLMAELMMKSQFRDTEEDILAGLDTHLQTGEVVDQDGNPETADAPIATAA